MTALTSVFGNWPLAFRLARREARTGFGGFRIFILCLALGVGAIASVGLLAAAFQQGLIDEGREILGGDVELTLVQRRISDKERAFLRRWGKLSEVASMRAMAHRTDGKDATLVEIKAIDGAYPLTGQYRFKDKSLSLAALRKGPAIAADQILLDRLGVKPGERLKIGDQNYRIVGAIAAEPDRLGTGLSFGPRVLMSSLFFKQTGLVKPGALIRWRYRVNFSETAARNGGVAAFRVQAARFPNAGWRIKDRSNAAPRIKRFVDRLGTLLTFVAMTALVVGGVGIATAAKSYLDGRIRTIATLKCLGAPGGLIFRLYLVHLMRMVLIGGAIGLVLGLIFSFFAGPLVQTLSPLPARFAIYWLPMGVAMAYGIGITLLFAVWSLGLARAVPAATLYRAHIAGLPRWPGIGYLIATIAILAVLVALTFWLVPNIKFAAIYIGGVIGSFVLFWIIAHGLVRLARRVEFKQSRTLRLALIHLRGASMTTVSTVIALGLGLTLLVTLALIQGNFVRHLLNELPKSAPSFFFVDIQRDQMPGFEAAIRQGGAVKSFHAVPMLRGRIVRLNGVPAAKIKAGPGARWVLRGDRGITYAATKPQGVELSEGRWWPEDYSGPPLVSFAAGVASELGVKLGDSVTVNVLGREITARIANLRNVNWGSLGINFVMVFDPGEIKNAPHTYLATLAMAERDEARVMREVAEKFANITIVRVREVLQSVNDLLAKLLLAARLAGGLTLITGIAVLIGALASGQRRRRLDAVILKTLGLKRGELLKVYVLEHLLLAAVTSLFAVLCGAGIAFGLLKLVFHVPWQMIWPSVAVTVLGAVLLTVLLGLAGTWRILGVKPARILHQE
jgi:putative ABC transport system permease protein